MILDRPPSSELTSYVRSQALLFSAHDIALSGVESSGLLVGCLLLTVAYARTGLAEIDVYPSRAVLRSSITVIIVGCYLLAVGILAQVVRRFGGAESFQFQALIVLAGMAGLAVLLLSDRLRQKIRAFVGRHFGKAQHDSVRLWSEFSRRLAGVRDQAGLSSPASRLIADAFEALSVTVWLSDEEKDHLWAAASTGSERGGLRRDHILRSPAGEIAAQLRAHDRAVRPRRATDPGPRSIASRKPPAASNGGPQACACRSGPVNCFAGHSSGRRVNGAPYSIEELVLLRCIGRP